MANDVPGRPDQGRRPTKAERKEEARREREDLQQRAASKRRARRTGVVVGAVVVAAATLGVTLMGVIVNQGLPPGAKLEGATIHRLPPSGREALASALHPAFLLASPQGLSDLSRWQRFGRAAHPVAGEQPQVVIQPPPTPPVPTEAPLPPGAQQVPPDLLLHPVLDEAEAPA